MKKFMLAIVACALLTAGCSSGSIATVNGKKITQAQVQFYQDNFKSSLDTSNGLTEGAIKYAENNELVLAIAEKKNTEFTADDETTLKNQLISFRRSRGGTNAYEKYLKDMKLDENFVKNALKADLLKTKLEEDEDFSASDDELKDYFKNNYYRAKHILISTMDMSTGEKLADDKLTEAKAKADDLLNKAKSGANFDELMNENSEDPGSKSQPDGYVFTAGQMVSEFEDAVKNCEINGITMCESDYGYHIILRLPLDETPEMFDKEFNNVKSSLKSEVSDKKFNDSLESTANNLGIKVTANEKNTEKAVSALTSATPYPTPDTSSKYNQ